MLLNTYLERDKHQDGQCSCTPTARCRSFQRVTEHMIKAHSEALTRRWFDWMYQESFHPPKEVVKKQADEDATRRIKELEDQVEGLEKQVANIKQEEETLINDMEVTGQALAEQNSRLIQQLKEKDNANVRLMSEQIKLNQIAKQAREEKEMYIQQVATLTTSLESQIQVVRKLEEKERLLQTNLATGKKEEVMGVDRPGGSQCTAGWRGVKRTGMPLPMQSSHKKGKVASQEVVTVGGAEETAAEVSKDPAAWLHALFGRNRKTA